MAFYDRNKAGVLVSRMTADIESMGELIQWGLLQFVSAGLLVVITLLVMLVISWQLTLAVLVVAARPRRRLDPLPAPVERRVPRRARAGRATTWATLQEGIAGVRVIQAYDREQEQTRRFHESNQALYRSNMHTVKISTWYFGLVEASGVFAAGPRDRRRRLARAPRRGHGRHGHRVRAVAGQPVRPGAAAVAAVQHGAERGRRAATSCTTCSTPCPTSPSTPIRSCCRRPARSSSTT